MSYFLKQITGGDPERPIIILLTRNEVRIGRKLIPGLGKNRLISKVHADFHKSDDGVWSVKNSSINGVFVNGTNIGNASQVLSVGDVISFGNPLRRTAFVCTLCVQNSHDAAPEVVDLTEDSPSLDVKRELPSPRREDSNVRDNECAGSSRVSNGTPIHDENCNVSDQAAERAPNTSQYLTELRSPRIKTKIRCAVPLIRCDSEYFQWPPDVKNPFTQTQNGKYSFRHKKNVSKSESSDFSLESDEASTSSSSANRNLPKKRKYSHSNKKRVRKLSSDSSTDSCEQRSFRKTQNRNLRQVEQRHSSDRYKRVRMLSADSSDENHEEICCRKTQNRHSSNHKKRVRKLSSDSSDETSEEVVQSSSYRSNQDSNLKQSQERHLNNRKNHAKKLNFYSSGGSSEEVVKSSSYRSNQDSSLKQSQERHLNSRKNHAKKINFDSPGGSSEEVVKSSSHRSNQNSSLKQSQECHLNNRKNHDRESSGGSSIESDEKIMYPSASCFSNKNTEKQCAKNENFPARQSENKQDFLNNRGKRVGKVPYDSSKKNSEEFSTNSSSHANQNRQQSKNERSLPTSLQKYAKKINCNSSVEDNEHARAPSERNTETTAGTSKHLYKKTSIGQIEDRSKQFQGSMNGLSASVNIAPSAGEKVSSRSESQVLGNGNYSQNEEIITISDDDYLDFRSLDPCVHIKREPEENEDLDDEYLCKLIFEGGDESEHAPFYQMPGNSACQTQETESIESIREFVNCSVQKNAVAHGPAAKAPDSNAEIDIPPEKRNFRKAKNYTDNCVMSSAESSSINTKSKQNQSRRLERVDKYAEGKKTDNSVLAVKKKREKPVKIMHQEKEKNSSESVLQRQESQESNSADGEAPQVQDSPEISPDEAVLAAVTFPVLKGTNFTNGKLTKPTRKTLLTDAKPMQNRSRKFRGRDEGCEERRKSGEPSQAPVKSIKERSGKEPRPEIKANKTGSSAPVSKASHKNVHNGSCGSTNLRNVSKKKPESSNIKDSGKKATSVKRRPDKFSSRMGPLIDEIKASEEKNASNIGRSKTTSSTEKKSVPSKSANTVTTEDKLLRNKTASDIIAPETVSHSSNKEVAVTSHRELRQYRANSSHSNDTRNATYKPLIDVSESRTRKSNPHAFEPKFYDMVKSLIKMSTIWLKEQTVIKNDPPPAVTEGVAALPLSFTTYESYVSSFYPMIMLEIWQSMYVESKQVYATSKQYRKFRFSILSCDYKQDYIELKCESVVCEKSSFVPREGMIAILELKQNFNNSIPSFAYIYKHKSESLNLNSLKLPCWKQFPEEFLRRATHWTFFALVKHRDISFDMDSLMVGNGIRYIRNKLRLVDALRLFKDSPLLTDILEPKLSTFELNCVESSSTTNYSPRQMEIIRAICWEIFKPAKKVKIVLLQGGPGTGKTHTIIGLLESLFYGSKHKPSSKVLVTAPSDAAIDVIGCRLIELNEKYNYRDYTVNFVRVGLEKEVHHKVLPFFIDRKASNARRKEQLKRSREQCNRLQYQSAAKAMDSSTEMKYKIDILKESHIVLSTLSGCGLSLMQTVFKPNSDVQFSCCIVDDSTQCTELEVLQPLMFGIGKLVLVGDLELPPTNVFSELTEQYRYNVSMFARFHLYFDRHKKPSPVLTLTEQFRMHSGICEFPSKYIYTNQLVTNPETSLRYKDFPLKPFVILDIPESNNVSDKMFQYESLIYKICKVILDFVNPSTRIAIIISHESHRKHYIKPLQSISRHKEIEMTTIDAFRGREMDVIVLFAFLTDNLPGDENFISCQQRFNIALTRAKRSLIVCGHLTTLERCAHWQPVIKNAQERNLCYGVTTGKDISMILKNCARRKGNQEMCNKKKL